MKEIENKEVIKFILKMIKPFPWSIFVMFLVAVIWAIDLSIRPYFMKIILDRVSSVTHSEVISHLLIPSIGYVTSTFILSTSYRVYEYFVLIRFVPKLRKNITADTVKTLLKQSHGFYQNNFAGNIANKIKILAQNVPELVHKVIDGFFAHSLGLILAISTLWQIDIKFAIAIIIWIIVFTAGSTVFFDKFSKLSDISAEKGSVLMGFIVDLLSNISTVRLFARSKYEKKLINNCLSESVQAERNLQKAQSWVWLFYGYSFVILEVWCLYALLKGREADLISVGDFALVLGINTAVAGFFWQLTTDISECSKNYGEIVQALRITLSEPEIIDKEDSHDLNVDEGKIVFDNVSFSYNDSKKLFNKLSVVIEPKQRVGLIGFSGSGKTSFVNLLLRLYDIQEGEILIDGQNIQDISQDSLRGRISMIPQDLSLFNRTILENIKYGKLEASEEEVIQASIEAGCHDFISNLSSGYQYSVGERGLKISGGQKQRVIIARAFLKNAPILILDEATSQLDSITEDYIQQSLEKLMNGKTTLVIAHRLSTIRSMDRILVFDRGRIVQDGTHDQLISEEGLYKQLWASQVGGFLLEEKKPPEAE